MNCNQVHQEFTASVDSVMPARDVRDRFGPPAIRAMSDMAHYRKRGYNEHMWF